jgi:hypothetical protein
MRNGRSESAFTRPGSSRTVLIGMLLLVVACGPPKINSIAPGSGYPRQLLAVKGNALFAKVVWDAGLPTETELYNGLFGTSYFQVPAGSAPGAHPVALRSSQGTSNMVNVTVLAPSGVFPAPRIEDVGLMGVSGTGPIDAAIVITGANLDVNATVSINGSPPQVIVRWGALPVDFLLTHNPSTFGYPIYHYVQLLAIANNLALGSTVTIVVTNTDGRSATTTYTLPVTLAEQDSDGDGLRDAWETGSYTAPSGGTVDLAGMGTNARRKDILVEVDWIAAATPNATIWATIEAAFANAPVLNPNGSRGVNIIIDRGQGGAFTGGGTVLADHTTMDFGPNTAAGYTDFFTYKGNSFNNDRLNVFHYAIFGRARPNGSSGVGEIVGNDFMVTFRNFNAWNQPLAQAGTFIHELGHNLGLTHGDLLNTPGQYNESNKPNFASTMSYRWQFPGVSIDCNWASEGFHTYSAGYYARITESSVNENVGICDNSPLDMNADGQLSNPVAIDFKGDGTTTAVHDDFDQWGKLFLNFRAPGSGWNNN